MKVKDHNYYGALDDILSDLDDIVKQLQAEPKTTVANTLLFETGYNEWLADGKEADIDKIIREIEHCDDYMFFDVNVYDLELIKAILTKHLTQKTTVHKDGGVVEMREVWENSLTFVNTFKCDNCWWNMYWHKVKYCCECWAKIKRID